jgi:hypothetical protein
MTMTEAEDPAPENGPRPRWRDVLSVHPAADLFPRMSAAELAELGKDIRKNGLISSLVLWQASDNAPVQLLDGRNRLDALELALGRPVRVTSYTKQRRTIWRLEAVEDGESTPVADLIGDEYLHNPRYPVAMTVEPIVLGPDTDPYAYVTAANLHRRHLTTGQKHELIAKLIKIAPERSNRQIAKLVKVSHVTVGTARTELESTGQIDQLKKTVGADGRSRPTKKSAIPALAPPEKDDESISDGKPKADLTKKQAEIAKMLEPFKPGERRVICDRALTLLEGDPEATA